MQDEAMINRQKYSQLREVGNDTDRVVWGVTTREDATEMSTELKYQGSVKARGIYVTTNLIAAAWYRVTQSIRM